MAGAPRKRLKRLKEAGDEKAYAEFRDHLIRIGKEDIVKEVEEPDKHGKYKNIDGDNIMVQNQQAGKTYKMAFEDSVLMKEILAAKEELKKKASALGTDAAAIQELKIFHRAIKKLANDEMKLIFKYDFEAFDDYFFQDLQDRVETPDFHIEMFNLFQNTMRGLVVAPRGSAKSTNTRKYLIHQIVHGLTKYCIIVGSSEEMAGQNMRWARDQLTENKLIVQVYGNLKNSDKWSDTSFMTKDGVKVTARGWEQKLRGSNEKGRPDLMIFDDIEDDEAVNSKERRKKLKNYLTKAWLPMMSRYGRILFTGTILHMDSLLRNMAKNKPGYHDHIKWDVLFYKAIQKDVSGKEVSYWPQMWPIEILQAKRRADPQTFAQEYQNDPRSGVLSVFNSSEYRYYDVDDIQIDIKEKAVFYYVKKDGKYVKKLRLNTMMTTDFAISQKEGSDYTVFMITGMDHNERLYVLEYASMRTSDTDEMIKTIFALCKKWYCDYAVLEDRIIQKVLRRSIDMEMDKQEYWIGIKEVSRSDTMKLLRIKSLKAPIKKGNILWLEEHGEIEEELGEVTGTSLGSHDDYIDALADAWAFQCEERDEVEEKPVPVNTMEWAIAEGLVPTVEEERELAMYQ